MTENQAALFAFMNLQQDRMALLNALSSYREDTNSTLPVNPADIFVAIHTDCASMGHVAETGSINAADETIAINNRARHFLISEVSVSIGQF